jgi:hypothetical protein
MAKTRRVTRKASKKTRKGAKKSRKMSRGASEWNKLVMKHFRAGKAKSKAYSLRDAMMDAKKEKNRK